MYRQTGKTISQPYTGHKRGSVAPRVREDHHVQSHLPKLLPPGASRSSTGRGASGNQLESTQREGAACSALPKPFQTTLGTEEWSRDRYLHWNRGTRGARPGTRHDSNRTDGFHSCATPCGGALPGNQAELWLRGAREVTGRAVETVRSSVQFGRGRRWPHRACETQHSGCTRHPAHSAASP